MKYNYKVLYYSKHGEEDTAFFKLAREADNFYSTQKRATLYLIQWDRLVQLAVKAPTCPE